MTGRNTSPHAKPPPPSGRRRLGERLREQGLISQQQLEAALKQQQDLTPTKPLGQILIDLNMVKAEHVFRALAESVNIPFSVLTPEMVQPEALTCLTREFLEKHNLLPLSINDRHLTVAIEQFTNMFLLEEIARQAGRQIQAVAADPDNIRRTRQSVLEGAAPAPGRGEEAGDSLREILDQIRVDDLKVVEQDHREDDAELAANATDSPVVKLVNYVITNAVEMGASDIHIEPDDSTFRVRCRVDGELTETVRPSSRLLAAVVSRIKIMAGMDISERRLPQDGSMTVTLAERPIDLRVSTMTTKFGEKVVMRVVDREAAVRSLDSLGFDPDVLGRFRAVVREPSGMVLVTGPTGSGKSTTLYGALAELVSQTQNISTIEDPVERRLAGTSQFHIQPHAGFTFAVALRSLLRQDPDVIMVGEIRDAETAKLATEAALTGHMVLSTLHTNDAPTAVPRLVNMGVEPYLVAASLRAVLAQRLVRRLCPHCRQSAPVTAAERQTLTLLGSGRSGMTMKYVGAGCGRCRDAGCIGRIGIYELLVLTERMLTMITRDPDLRALQNVMREQGCATLLEDGLEKARRGLIGLESLLDIVSRTEEPLSESAPAVKAPRPLAEAA